MTSDKVRGQSGPASLRLLAGSLSDRGLAAYAFCLLAFLTPWVQGHGVFTWRVFSGFDLAVLLQEAGSDGELSLRLLPGVLYLVPAGVLMGIAVRLMQRAAGESRGRSLLQVCLASYFLVILAATAALSLLPGTEAHEVFDAPAWGLPLSLVAATALLLDGWRPSAQATVAAGRSRRGLLRGALRAVAATEDPGTRPIGSPGVPLA